MIADDGASAPFFIASAPGAAPRWQTTRYAIDLTQPRVMGIVNLTPDSFSRDGHASDVAAAMAHCEALLQDGADILDLGAESTRPGAFPVAWQDEWQRLAPVLSAAVRLGCPVSVDSMKTEVMERSVGVGVDILNDVNALREPGASAVAAASACGVCLMHMRGVPSTMQHDASDGGVVDAVRKFLSARARELQALGVAAERIVLDPGIGFGKTVHANFALLRGQRDLLSLGYPLLVGWSRKSSLGAVTGKPVSQRAAASVAAALAAVHFGARVLRVHDVAATVDALRVWKAAGLPDGD